MSQSGYQEGSERTWWWSVAQHLDSAQLAAVNAMAHNLEDQTMVFALEDKLREAQVILLEIFRTKGLLPGAPNGSSPQPITNAPAPLAPPQPPPGASPPGMAFAPPPPPPPPFAGASAPFVPPSMTVPEGIGDVRPPTSATKPPPMIVTDDIPLVSETDPS